MKHFSLFCAMAVLLGEWAARAQFIDIRVSYKLVRNPADNSLPPNTTRESITNTVAAMNQMMAGYQRGYRFRLVDAVTPIGFSGDPTGPSRFYNTDFFTASSAKEEMEQAAINDVRYHWNTAAVNIYITGGLSGGICSFPGGDHIVIIGADYPADRHLHEIGHYFNLYHTQGASCAECTGDGACPTPGNDGISDTLNDVACWGQNEIAMWPDNFGQPYAALSDANQERVKDVFFNVMSYHNRGNRTRLTEGQLDRFTDGASGPREHVVSGETVFVDHRNACLSPAGGSGCTLLGFGGPFPRVIDGVNFAEPGGVDIVTIRPGNYNEQFTINKNVTLRATRAGPVTIGRP